MNTLPAGAAWAYAAARAVDLPRAAPAATYTAYATVRGRLNANGDAFAETTKVTATAPANSGRPDRNGDVYYPAVPVVPVRTMEHGERAKGTFGNTRKDRRRAAAERRRGAA